jgi:hypothetical protein
MKSTPASTAQSICSSKMRRCLLLRLGVLRIVDAGVADVAGEEGARAAGDLLGDAQGGAIDLRQVSFAADHPELGAMGVVGEGLDHVRSGVDELAVERFDEVRPLEDDFGHIGAGLEIAAPLELEEVPFGADHRALGEPLEQPTRLRLGPARLRSLDAPLLTPVRARVGITPGSPADGRRCRAWDAA